MIELKALVTKRMISKETTLEITHPNHGENVWGGQSSQYGQIDLIGWAEGRVGGSLGGRIV